MRFRSLLIIVFFASFSAFGQDAESLIATGNQFYKSKNYKAAEESYKAAESVSKNNKSISKSFYNKGNALIKSNDLDGSIKAYEEALKRNPDDLDAKYNLSYALAKKKKSSSNSNQAKPNQSKKDEPQKEKDQKSKKQDQSSDEKDQTDGMTRKDAERILNALRDKEGNVLKRINSQNRESHSQQNDKPW